MSPVYSGSLFCALICLQSAFALWREIGWDSRWDDWWHYKEGAMGSPSQWGSKAHMVYPVETWPACQRGRRQSPVNISTDSLVFDHSLSPLRLHGGEQEISMILHNTGQDITYNLTAGHVILSGGPLSYEYQLFGAVIKFGRNSARGSEHHINGVPFPAEFQIYGFNQNLYENYSEAVNRPYGLVALTALMRIGETTSKDLRALITATSSTRLKGQRFSIHGISITTLLPSMRQYMTYEGSLPFPACHETVTWLVLNQPMQVTETELKTLRQLRMSRHSMSRAMADNYRPLQMLNNRSVRTNINLDAQSTPLCTVRKEVFYTANLPAS